MGMQEVRDLINEAAIRGTLMADSSGKWHRVCTAMDVLSQGGSLSDRIDSVNTLAAEAEVPGLTPEANDADVENAISAIESGLDRRHRTLRRGYAKRPLSHAFKASDLSYALEKVSSVASGYEGDMPMALGGASVLETAFATMRDGMNERGYGGNDETRTALYVVERVRDYVSGAPGAPSAADLDVMTREALPSIVARLTRLAAEIDAEDRSF